MRKELYVYLLEKSRQAASYGLLIALAMVFGYIESLLPLPVPVPGMKIGLANLVTIVCLEFVGIRGGRMGHPPAGGPYGAVLWKSLQHDVWAFRKLFKPCRHGGGKALPAVFPDRDQHFRRGFP